MSPQQKIFYKMNNGQLCPYCEAPSVEAEPPEITQGSSEYKTKASCPICNESWQECHILVDIEPITEK